MVTIAIIGQGAMGRTHAKAWASLGLGDQIRYVCTPRPGAPLEYAPAARFVTDLDAVLADPGVDVLSVCTPTPSHAHIATRALRAGKHVLLEKPIALTREDARAIQSEAGIGRSILMVAHVVRFFEGYRLIRDAVDTGRLGQIVSGRARRIMATPNTAPWWHDEAQSGGVVVDVGIHDFDQLNLFLGTPTAVRAVRQGLAAPVETTVEYLDGGIGQVLSAANLPNGVPFTTSIELVGTAGLAEYQFSAGVPAGHAESGEQCGVSTYRLATAEASESVGVVDNDPYTRQAEYFLECVRNQTQPTLCPTESAIAALEVALAARASLQAGGDQVTLAL
jgi:predicted dehydrogenase